TYTLDVSGVSAATVNLVIPAFTFVVNPSSTLPVTLTGDIASAATAKSVRLSVDLNSWVTAKDDVTSLLMGIATQGDPTGFPMASNVLLIMAPGVVNTYGNYPNPFRAGMENTTLEFYLASPAAVSLVIYDVTGNKVKTLVGGQSLPAGLQQVAWDGRNGSGALVVNGVYYAQLDVAGNKLLQKIAVVK